MAIAMRDSVGELGEKWQRQGHSLGFGVGIARGHATIGKIGFDRRSDYAVIGSVPNLAARLCDMAKAGQILASQRAYTPIESLVEVQPLGELTLKGFHRPMTAFDIVRWLS
jgi:class 3 adenylate cyclase